ncbi:MAG: ABC transporter permease, partial [Anaerolineae bacterium]|nr:ABC transporter permease [Anaerolineae bacterium]
NFFIYSGIAVVYGIIGVIPGVLVGIPGGNAAAHALAPQLNTIVEGFQISVSSIILGAAVGLLVPAIASLLPVFNGTRVQILEAMTDLGIDANYGSGLVARFIGALPIPITVRQGLSNVSLKKGRLAFTVITLAIAVGAFMGIFALFESLTDGIESFFNSWNIDFGVFPTEPRDPEQMANILTTNFGDQVNDIQPGFMQQIEFEGYTPEITAGGPPGIFAYGYDITAESPAFLFEISEGEKLTPETASDGIILSSLLAANMDKSVGDNVVMRVPGQNKEFKVIGIADFPIEQAWAAWDVLALLRDSTIDTITSDSLIPVDTIPAEARGFIKYATVAEVSGYEPGGPLPGALVMGFSPSVAQFLQFEEGTFPDTDTPGIMVSSAMAEQGGYSVGDSLTLSSLTANGDKDVSYPVAGIFAPPVVFAENAMVSPDFIGMNWQMAADFDGAIVERVALPGGYFITVPEDEPSPDEIGDLMEAVNETYVNQGIGIIGFNFVELTQQISDAFVTIQAILSAVAGLIALVGALGLLTTLSMSVFERQKEIGVMRSIGAGSSTVAIQFLTEGIVVGVIAWLVGIPLMVGIQYLLLSITGFDETFPFQFSPTAVMVGLIGMLVITTIASLWPSLAAARKTVSDILRYQ